MNFLPPLIMITIGVWHYLRHGMDMLAIVPVMLGVFALYMALFNRPLLRHTLELLTKLMYPVGQLITLALFTVMFFLVFAPVGLLLRLLKKDILDRDPNQGRLSYWIERPVKEQNDYTQQF